MALYNAYPGRVNIISIHAGGFAVPSAGQPDFRTAFGDALVTFSGLNAYPAGTMNRVVWSGSYNQPPYFPQNPPDRLAIRRPGWWDTGYPEQGAGAYIILNGGISPVNIGVNSNWNAGTRVLIVNLELYYTSAETVNNAINVVLVENGVIGYQSGGGSNYVHNHILRHMLTGQWGDIITAPAGGTLITKTYNYTVPANYNGIVPNMDNCEITVFVTRADNKTTHTGITIPAKNGGGATSLPEKNIGINNFNVFPNPLNGTSIVTFNLEKAENTSIELFSSLGTKIFHKELGNLGMGNHQLSVDFINEFNLSDGIYLLKLNAGTDTKTMKLIK